LASSTVTVDTGEWEYIDSFGVGHFVTNGQTFTLTVTDGGAAAVSYNIPVAQSVTLTDGLTLTFRPETTMSQVNNAGAFDTIHFLTDAGQGSNFYGLAGELVCECPVSGRIQRWVPATMNPSDADYGSAGTIGASFEDQFGNKMSFTGVTVGQAA